MRLNPLYAILTILVSAWLIFPSCGSGDYTSTVDCGELCQKNLECDATTNVTECTAECEQAKELIRGAVFDAMTDCVLTLPCNSDQAQACLDSAMTKAPKNAADGLIRTMCQKQISCAGGTVEMTVSQCVEMTKTQYGEYLEYLNAFKSSVLSCLSSCVNGLSCADLETDDFMDPCMESCGIPVGEDGTGP